MTQLSGLNVSNILMLKVTSWLGWSDSLVDGVVAMDPGFPIWFPVWAKTFSFTTLSLVQDPIAKCSKGALPTFSTGHEGASRKSPELKTQQANFCATPNSSSVMEIRRWTSCWCILSLFIRGPISLVLSISLVDVTWREQYICACAINLSRLKLARALPKCYVIYPCRSIIAQSIHVTHFSSPRRCSLGVRYINTFAGLSALCACHELLLLFHPFLYLLSWIAFRDFSRSPRGLLYRVSM